ncbi:GTP cyclohydrolase II [Sunxiuqinia dokdonensis]|uniref:GTP cyclohydrolase-2 n=1 Tax=Sunxiuqinia dokdonensis TaxID=1409788 RepID=A0A0L8VF96_9BACT|nr:GTP cyclohydrolase II [Sunxiuqinia dokdonensis]KOH46852.1 3,4-dihydroxy-2-butanone 4-phosphate synthase [Sunxiuqinia dokdonensis]
MFEFQNRPNAPHLLETGERVQLPTIYGSFELLPFMEIATGKEHIALTKGPVENKKSVLLRIHSACATGDLFGSMRCDCGEQLHRALQAIEQEGRGVLIYLQQEGRGIGLMQKMKAYKLQEQGVDTVDANLQLGHQADERDYRAAAEILRQLNISQVKLLTNNPNKKSGLEKYGINVACCIPLLTEPNPHNAFYLQTKEKRMGHLLGQLNFENHE